MSLLLTRALQSVYIACKDGNFAYHICTYWHLALKSYLFQILYGMSR